MTEQHPASPALEDQLCFALYSASRATTAAYADVLERYGLTYPQYLVLLVLWEGDGVTVGELGRRLRLTSATLSPLLQRLEKAGRIVRRRSTTDARTVTVHLTADGEALRGVVDEAQRCLAEGLSLSPAEVRLLHDLATRLVPANHPTANHPTSNDSTASHSTLKETR